MLRYAVGFWVGGLGDLRFDFDLVAWGVPVVCIVVGLVDVGCFGLLVFCVVNFCLRWYYVGVVVYCSRLSGVLCLVVVLGVFRCVLGADMVAGGVCLRGVSLWARGCVWFAYAVF